MASEPTLTRQSIAATVLFPSQVCFSATLCFIKQHENVIARTVCGFMLGSSIFLPMLFTASVNNSGQGLLWLTTTIWTVSTTIFAFLMRKEIAENALYTIPWTAIPALYMVHSPEQSMYHFMSMAPFWISVGLVLTIVFTPEARRFVQRIRNLIMDPVTTGVSSDGSQRTDFGTVDLNSDYASGFRGLSFGPLQFTDHTASLPYIGAHFELPSYTERFRYHDTEMGIANFDIMAMTADESSIPLLPVER